MATYEMIKKLITRDKTNGTLDKEAWMKKLDVFTLADRITTEQYQELFEMIG